MLEIFRLRFQQLRVDREIIVAVRHPEAALENVQCISVGFLAVLPDETAIRRIDPQLVGIGIELREVLPRLDRANLAQPRLEWRQALRIDRRLVPEALLVMAGLAVRILRRLVDDGARPLLRQIVEHVEHAVASLVWWNRRVLRPGP